MKSSDAAQKILKSFERYYTIKRPGEDSVDGGQGGFSSITKPFFAEAVFKSHTEQYFLVKSAKLSESDSSERVFFYVSENLDMEKLLEIEETAWREGLSGFVPYFGHRNTDVTLVIVSDRIEGDAFDAVRKIKHSKSYMMTLKGWSDFRLAALETSTMRATYNRLGKSLKKTVEAI